MNSLDSLKHIGVGFHRDRRATTLTEFVITLPILVLIFVGMNELGSWGDLSVSTRVEATHRTFSNVYDVHRTAEDDLGSSASSAYFSDPTHLMPAAATVDAQIQLTEHPIRQESTFSEMLVEGQERGTYLAMATNGHLGESYARLQPAQLMPQSHVPGLYNAIERTPNNLFGSGANGSRLATDLLYDGMEFNFSTDDCQGVAESIASVVNQGIGAAGIRPMLAAGMRYGTVTGSVDTNVTIPVIGQHRAYAYFNTAVPPFVFEEKPGLQPALTMVFTRLAMMNCAMVPYSGLMGVGGDQRLPPVGQGVLAVPAPNIQAPGAYNNFAYPLDYYSYSTTEKP